MEKYLCHISKKRLPLEEVYKGEMIRKELLHFIKKDHPDFKKSSYISLAELSIYRHRYMSYLIKGESGELNQIENEVLDAISKNKILNENVEVDFEERLKVGQKVADKVAKFGGSWTFIMFFFSFIIVWMIINIWALAKKSFDPYPFILLNLILSCLAAIQAPVIMMSQNRKEEKDRKRSENDYKVNLKAELEIKFLNEKVDHLMIHQNRRLLEIQQLQTDYLEDLLRQTNTTDKSITTK
jgi:uncharacterized membrane protein